MNEHEKKRYARQMTHAGFGEKEQKRLRNSEVLLAGIGGLGGAIAYGLVGAGIGKLVIIHEGDLEEPDLNRQTLMKESRLGQPRVETAAERLREFSGLTEIEVHNKPVSAELLASAGKNADIFIDARHNFPERRILNRVAVIRNVPLLFAAMDGMEAQAALFVSEKNGCLDCLYPRDPGYWDPYGFSVFGAVAHTIGSMAAMMAIKHLAGFGKSQEKLLVMNVESMEISRFSLRKRGDCPTCGVL